MSVDYAPWEMLQIYARWNAASSRGYIPCPWTMCVDYVHELCSKVPCPQTMSVDYAPWEMLQIYAHWNAASSRGYIPCPCFMFLAHGHPEMRYFHAQKLCPIQSLGIYKVYWRWDSVLSYLTRNSPNTRCMARSLFKWLTMRVTSYKLYYVTVIISTY